MYVCVIVCRRTWKVMYQVGLDNYSENRTAKTIGCRCEVVCHECSRKFKRKGDRNQSKSSVGLFSVRTATDDSGAGVG